ncbi:MAG TPA: GntR family transcriptional regulator [Gaiellales bacterium]|jgi:DNA-binding GntR family transcriptional regulator|nr:GntR family transcriptional regulator [Gaiellales bacterium]
MAGVRPIPATDGADTTKADDIGAALERAILFGEIAPGTLLRQEQLAEQYGVSRTPIREALRRLDALGLVVFRPNRGVLVRAPSRDELRQSIVVRAALEGVAAELAAERISPDQVAALAAAERRYEELTRRLQSAGLEAAERRQVTVDWLRANDVFHDIVLDAAGMPLLHRMARSVRRVLGTPRLLTLVDELGRIHDENVRQHRALLEAIRAGSGRAAHELMTEHIVTTGRAIEEMLDRVPAPDGPRRAETGG